MDINQVYNIILNELNLNELGNEIKIGASIIIRNIEYEIIKKLGKGGLGRVIQLKNKSDNKYYAIKEIIIKPEMQDKLENIKKEADILSKFNCDNIVKYYDSYLDKDKFYILMKYCAGKSFKKFYKYLF